MPKQHPSNFSESEVMLHAVLREIIEYKRAQPLLNEFECDYSVVCMCIAFVDKTKKVSNSTLSET